MATFFSIHAGWLDIDISALDFYKYQVIPYGYTRQTHLNPDTGRRLRKDVYRFPAD